MHIYSNIVEQKTLHEQTMAVLQIIADSLVTSFGPYGSATQIKKDDILPKFTKDGHTILKNIYFNGTLEMSIREVLEDLTSHVVKNVGDGTTSAILLSQLIYKRLATKCEPNRDNAEIYNWHLPPAELERQLNELVKRASETIMSQTREIQTYEDIHKIALISTNNNEEMAELISGIYMENGTDVYIDVKRSMDSQDYIKIFDGMTLDAGYADKVFVTNEAESTAEINAPKIYFFEDPIDTPEMINFFSAIIYHNIMEPLKDRRELTPTVIMCPKVSSDIAAVMDPLVKTMMNAKANNFNIPFCLVSDIYKKEVLMDLANLCDARTVRKYINLEQQEKDQENGDAPTVDTIVDWCGTADAVVAGYNKTKIINPKLMYKEGTTEFSDFYKSIINNLEMQLAQAKQDGKNLNDIGNLRRRIHSMKANMVDLYIGGSTPEERDNRFDAAEDAVLNCMSAAEHGYGWGANIQAFNVFHELHKNPDTGIISVVYNSYLDLLAKLYGSSLGEVPSSYSEASDEVKDMIKTTIETKTPINLRTGEADGLVLSSIKSDITVLDIVANVVGMLVTTKQFLCQSPAHNIYKD